MEGIRKVFQFVWSALFPRACVLCAHEGEILCAACEKNVQRPKWHVHAEREGIRIFSRASYKEKAIQRLLHAWKYQGDRAAGAWWEVWIAEEAQAPQIFYGAVFVPVPLAREAYAERGFNQAEVLAHALAKKYKGSVVRALGRFPRRAQAKTAKEQRGDMRTASPYYLNPECKKYVTSANVVLVDDVCTTGSTIMACADVLRACGREKIDACTLAYGNAA